MHAIKTTMIERVDELEGRLGRTHDDVHRMIGERFADVDRKVAALHADVGSVLAHLRASAPHGAAGGGPRTISMRKAVSLAAHAHRPVARLRRGAQQVVHSNHGSASA